MGSTLISSWQVNPRCSLGFGSLANIDFHIWAWHLSFMFLSDPCFVYASISNIMPESSLVLTGTQDKVKKVGGQHDIWHRNFEQKVCRGFQRKKALCWVEMAKFWNTGTSVLLYLTEGKHRVSSWKLLWLKSPFMRKYDPSLLLCISMLPPPVTTVAAL